MLDLSLEEENIAGTKLTDISNTDGSISSIQKSGRNTLTIDQVYYIIDIACEKAKEIREKFLEI